MGDQSQAPEEQKTAVHAEVVKASAQIVAGTSLSLAGMIAALQAKAATQLQAVVRGEAARKLGTRHRASAVTIQAAFRLAQSKRHKVDDAARTIQDAARAHLKGWHAAKRAQTNQQQRAAQRAANTIQRSFRRTQPFVVWRGTLDRALKAKDWKAAQVAITALTPVHVHLLDVLRAADLANAAGAPVAVFNSLVDKYPLAAASVAGAARCQQWATAEKLLNESLPSMAKPWKWGKCESSSMKKTSATVKQCTNNGWTVKKTSSSPDYSGALGSAGFDCSSASTAGVQSWDLQIIEDANRCWFGVATADVPLNTRASGISSDNSARLWYWGYDGVLSSNNGQSQPGTVSDGKFSENDVLRFTLDCKAGTMVSGNGTHSSSHCLSLHAHCVLTVCIGCRSFPQSAVATDRRPATT